MSDEVATRLQNLEALVLSLKTDRRQQLGSDDLQSVLSSLVQGHATDLKHYLLLITDAVTNERDEVQIDLLSTQIENGFRNLAQNIAGIISGADISNHDATQQGFEEQIELMKRNNAEFLSAVTRLTAFSDARDLLGREDDLESKSQTREIERLKAALELAQKNSHEVQGVDSAEHWESKMKSREAELVAQHQAEILLFTKKYRALFEAFSVAKGNIRVICRIRDAKDTPSEAIIKMEDPQLDFLWTRLRATYQNDSKKTETRDFEFRRVFGGDETNQDVFAEVKDFAESATLGQSCTVMAYGATGTGKSFLFLSHDGLIRSYLSLLFQLSEQERDHYEYEFQLSAVEIYLNKVYSLLQHSNDNQKVEIRPNADEFMIKLGSLESAIVILEQTIDQREVASTQQNATSSRSHFILTIHVSKRSLANSNEKPVKGSIRFLDLAGSERVGRNSLSGGSGPQQTLLTEQGNDINKSLLDLGKGIRSLATGDRFVPSHNLTRYIRSSLSQGSRLLIAATVSPLIENQNSSLNTLRWSQDATGLPSQGKLVTQAKAPSNRPLTTGGSRPRNPSVTSAKVTTPTRRSAPTNQGSTKR